MQCPAGRVAVHLRMWHSVDGTLEDSNVQWVVAGEACPNCSVFVVALRFGGLRPEIIYPHWPSTKQELIRAHEDVPREFAEDYEEAALILKLSPKASAALSRRCLQHILREKAGVRERNLKTEIEKAIDANILPSDLTESMVLLRDIGNLGAHATKDENTGEIVPVEPGEAEWCLQLIHSLFDHYFVRPAQQERQRQAIREKLANTKRPSPTP